MVISRVIGGLGNQLFQYAIAKAIAKKNNLEYKLDLEHFENYNLFKYRLHMLNIIENVANHKEISKYHGNQSVLSKVIRRTVSPYFYREKQKYSYDVNIFNQDKIYLDGYWQNEKYFKDIADELKYEFTLKKIPEYALSKIDEIQNTESVAIHVRRGDYDKHSEFHILDMEYYVTAIETISKMHNNLKFFIFSNDKQWCEENFTFLENHEIVACHKNEVEDFFMMSKCKHNIIANSTFSWWAAWLNSNQKKVIIAPKHWKNTGLKSSDWLPKEWIKV